MVSTLNLIVFLWRIFSVTMQIIRTRCAQGARGVQGIVVVIDVFRAFTCEPLFFHFGVRKVILEADPERAIGAKKRHPDWILVGEQDEVPLEGSDLGNSPSEILLKGKEFFRDRTVIHRTTAGVTGAVAALKTAEEVLLGSFLTAGAIAAYIRGKAPGIVTSSSLSMTLRVAKTTIAFPSPSICLNPAL